MIVSNSFSQYLLLLIIFYFLHLVPMDQVEKDSKTDGANTSETKSSITTVKPDGE